MCVRSCFKSFFSEIVHPVSLVSGLEQYWGVEQGGKFAQQSNTMTLQLHTTHSSLLITYYTQLTANNFTLHYTLYTLHYTRALNDSEILSFTQNSEFLRKHLEPGQGNQCRTLGVKFED